MQPEFDPSRSRRVATLQRSGNAAANPRRPAFLSRMAARSHEEGRWWRGSEGKKKPKAMQYSWNSEWVAAQRPSLGPDGARLQISADVRGGLAAAAPPHASMFSSSSTLGAR